MFIAFNPLLIIEEVVAKYPDTSTVKEQKEYIDEYSSILDRSGIVGFYLGTMLTTTTWEAYSIPLILMDTEYGIVYITTGTLGIASGINTSWLLYGK